MFPNGFGGLGASYPRRYGDPTSKEVGWLPNAQEWQQNWDHEYAATLARMDPNSLAQTGPSLESEIARVTNDFVAKDSAQRGLNVWDTGKLTGFIGSALSAPDDAAFRMVSNYDSDIYGLGSAANHAKNLLGAEAFNYLSTYDPTGGAGDGFDFINSGSPEERLKQLEQEKAQMTPLLQNQTSLQQAYNSMLGNGQKNAVMGQGYAAPAFGQVNGQISNPFETPKQPNGAGPNMGWTSGVYNPSGSVGGPNPNTQQRWGL